MKKPAWWTDLLSVSVACLLASLAFAWLGCDALFRVYWAGSVIFVTHHIAVKNNYRGRNK